MYLLFPVQIVLVLFINNAPFLRDVGNTSAHIDGTNFWQFDSMSQPPLFTQNLKTNELNRHNLVFKCKHGRETYSYDRAKVEQLILNLPGIFDFEKNKTHVRIYPYYFRNDEGFDWPLNKIACDKAGKFRLEIPMGENAIYPWDWEGYLTFKGLLPSISRGGCSMPNPNPGLVRIIYVHRAGGGNLLCGVVIHKNDDRKKFKLCPLVEDT
ncbi:hypothetical protein F4805DRAFT_64165 [Annulohypoxylon moriforme]|nr:hypothetical protein F4805DRAFT_64165 [Annulohypoxylon moriforme]